MDGLKLGRQLFEVLSEDYEDVFHLNLRPLIPHWWIDMIVIVEPI